jgi:hypothetical protein
LERWKVWSWTNIVWRSNVIRFKTTTYTCFIHHRNPKPNYYQIGCLDNAFDLVNRTLRYSGNQINNFLQDLVCTCKGRSVCSKGCVCFEHNLSCIELCPCQALDICHNVITHRTDIGLDRLNYLCQSILFETNH